MEYPDLIVNLTNYSVLYKGHSVEMPPKELELLLSGLLAESGLYKRAAPGSHLGLRIHRRYPDRRRTYQASAGKIKDHANWSITTVWGIGYKFEVKR